ncbi:hypothetical protein [Rhodococcus sp. UNC23MFCrub1.1]|uniref:hypothetical protein n=1 Tax=Rhodococcus sp. UNC23MFCrub1.1 TaxID=1449068 RepID=UPI00068AA967|nr:hypothetical protein [Rhodococcus sp. UNC23MFCrub1.1]
MLNNGVGQRSTGDHAAPEGDSVFVPVDRRWWGLDRRSFAPAAMLVVVATCLAVVLPLVDDAMAAENPADVGDIYELDGDITVVPARGWDVVAGVRRGQGPPEYPSVTVFGRADTSFQISTRPFMGDATELLEQNAPPAASDSVQRPVTTDSGLHGVIAVRDQVDVDATVAAFVTEKGVGVLVVVAGAPAVLDERTEAQVREMIGSIAAAESPR